MNHPLQNIANALQVSLKVDGSGHVRMSEPIKYEIGPFKFERVAYLETDFVQSKAAGIFVKLLGSVWLYIEAVGEKMRCSVIDGKKIGLSLTTVSQFRTNTTEGVNALRSGRVAVVNYDFTKKEWVNAQAVRPVGDGAEQGTEHPGTSPSNASPA